MDEEVKERLKGILIGIACAEGNEVLKWGREQVIKGKSKIKMSADMSKAVSSIKMKAGADGIDVDVKLLDKLKAIELYFKICGISTSEGADELHISYDYISPAKEDKDDE